MSVLKFTKLFLKRTNAKSWTLQKSSDVKWAAQPFEWRGQQEVPPAPHVSPASFCCSACFASRVHVAAPIITLPLLFSSPLPNKVAMKIEAVFMLTKDAEACSCFHWSKDAGPCGEARLCSGWVLHVSNQPCGYQPSIHATWLHFHSRCASQGEDLQPRSAAFLLKAALAWPQYAAGLAFGEPRAVEYGWIMIQG